MATFRRGDFSATSRSRLLGSVTPIFLFVNPDAGGQKGAKIISRLGADPFEVSLGDGKVASLRAFSLKGVGPGSKEVGFAELCEEVRRTPRSEASKPIRVIAAGGDGTLKWVVAEARNVGLEPSQDLLFGILPLGTGNDFSRSTGWGGKYPPRLVSRRKEVLKSMVRRWCEASIRPHDVWMVRIDVDEDGSGKICSVGGDRSKITLETTQLDEVMTMYFSIGVEGQVGRGFDKRRTTNRLCNLCVYLWEGLKKVVPCRRHRRIGDLLASGYQGEDDDGKVIFDQLEEHGDAPKLLSRPETLAVVNIASFGGGSADLWHSATQLGVDRPLDDELLERDQDSGDGALEVVTIRNLTTVVLNCIWRRCSWLGPKRVFAGAPLFFEFVDGGDKEVSCHCQVDGQFYKLINPASVSIRHLYRLRVLYDDSQAVQEDSDDESDSSDSAEE